LFYKLARCFIACDETVVLRAFLGLGLHWRCSRNSVRNISTVKYRPLQHSFRCCLQVLFLRPGCGPEQRVGERPLELNGTRQNLALSLACLALCSKTVLSTKYVTHWM